MKVFPVLVLPGLLAWLIRYTTHKLQRRLMRFAPNSFYIWFIGLTLAMVLATHALFMNYPGGWALTGIVAVSVATCALQFFLGRRIGKGRVNSITAGQVAGGLYAIWQNLFNSWELYQHEHRK